MTTALKQEYDEKGYVIVREAVDADLARETAEHVHWLARAPSRHSPRKDSATKCW